MAEGAGEDAWLHTSNLMALVANCHRDPKKGTPCKATDFNPYYATKSNAVVVTKDTVHLMKNAFLGIVP